MKKWLIITPSIFALLVGMAHADTRKLLLLQGRGALWTPLNDPGLVEWWNPQDTAKITLNAGNVASWLGEKSAHTMAQVTAAAQPGYTGTINGLTVLTNTTATSMSSDTFTHPRNWIVGMVIRPGDVTQSPNYLNADNLSTLRQAQYLRAATTSFQSISFNASATPFSVSTSPIANATNYFVDAISNGTTLTPSITGKPGTSTAESGTMASVSIAMSMPSGSYTGLIGDVILTSTALASTEQKYQGFFACKYGLQSSLPSGHRYKFTCPRVNDP